MSSFQCVRFLKCDAEDIAPTLDKIGFRTQGLAKQSIYQDKIMWRSAKKKVVLKLTITAEVVEEP